MSSTPLSTSSTQNIYTNSDLKDNVVENPCPHQNEPAHTEWSCVACLDYLHADFDNAVRQHMHYFPLSSPSPIDTLSSLRQFHQRPLLELKPNPDKPAPVQRRAWLGNCAVELDARVEAALKYHATVTARSHLANKVNNHHWQITRAAPSDEIGEEKAMCKDSQGNELHPQWTCSRCLTNLQEYMDTELQNILADLWPESKLKALPSLRQFDVSPWSALTPDASQPQEVQVYAWRKNCLNELGAREDAVRQFLSNKTKTENRAIKI